MIKFDNDNFQTQMAIDDACERHPDKSDGPVKRFGVFAQPDVTVEQITGKALAWTPSYGLVAWNDSKGLQHMEWFQAGIIYRIAPEA